MKKLTFIFFFISIFSITVGCAQKTITKNGQQYLEHKVQKSETLYQIGRKYNVSPADIKKWNSLTSNSIDVGQTILIKKSGSKATISTATTTTSTKSKKHVVTKGETLYSIARDHQVNVNDIIKWNKLTSNELSIGQQLFVSLPTNSTTTSTTSTLKTKAKTHKVAPGETLYSIAKKHNLSVEDLTKLNDLKSASLSVGQELIVEKAPSTEDEEKKEWTKIEESGNVGLLMDERFNSKYAYCFHLTAPKGTIIKITNTTNGKFIYARVMGKSYGDLIKLNKTILNKIAKGQDGFNARLEYYN